MVTCSARSKPDGDILGCDDGATKDGEEDGEELGTESVSGSGSGLTGSWA